MPALLDDYDGPALNPGYIAPALKQPGLDCIACGSKDIPLDDCRPIDEPYVAAYEGHAVRGLCITCEEKRATGETVEPATSPTPPEEPVPGDGSWYWASEFGG